jgi:hypothetical protein
LANEAAPEQTLSLRVGRFVFVVLGAVVGDFVPRRFRPREDVMVDATSDGFV